MIHSPKSGPSNQLELLPSSLTYRFREPKVSYRESSKAILEVDVYKLTTFTKKRGEPRGSYPLEHTKSPFGLMDSDS